MIKSFEEYIGEGTLWGKSFERGVEKDMRKENDPTKDIIDFMEKHRIGIGKYTINKDFTVDVNGSVRIEVDDLIDGRLPFRFGKVKRSFYCDIINLKSLDGCPKEVGGDFDCSNNQLESLAGSPETVGGDFDCYSNDKLKSLKGGPKVVGGGFRCAYNQLETLDGCPEKVGGNFNCIYNNKKFTEEDIRSLCDVKGSIYC